MRKKMILKIEITPKESTLTNNHSEMSILELAKELNIDIRSSEIDIPASP